MCLHAHRRCVEPVLGVPHAGPRAHELDDSDLQETYAFSDAATENHWTNLFVDRRPFIAAVPDDEVLRWVRGDKLPAAARER
jgi:hypothetical protein